MPQPTPASMRAAAPPILGAWEKTSTAACGDPYPARLEFRDDGLYFGATEPPGAFTIWDVGTYELAGASRIKLSTANDAVVTYDFTLADNGLAFVDASGCQISYRRAP